MSELILIPQTQFEGVVVDGDLDATLALLADMCRANALTAVKRAGSDHPGSSFSAMDIVERLFYDNYYSHHEDVLREHPWQGA